VIITAGSQFGPMLYDASGQAIYLFDAEGGTRPECYGDCADDWPPVLTTGQPQANGGARSDLLGTTRRNDGGAQVTYAGHPLYFYAHEGKYQVLCHDIEEYGGTWLVVQPDGEPAPQ
jgi:predicted lipoprotein with Yx(FWY)xxD motif